MHRWLSGLPIPIRRLIFGLGPVPLPIGEFRFDFFFALFHFFELPLSLREYLARCVT